MNQIDLKGRKAVVTGSAQGVGYSIASRLIDSGATRSLWDRDEVLLNKVHTELSNTGEASIEVVDVASAESVKKATMSSWKSTAESTSLSQTLVSQVRTSSLGSIHWRHGNR